MLVRRSILKRPIAGTLSSARICTTQVGCIRPAAIALLLAAVCVDGPGARAQELAADAVRPDTKEIAIRGTCHDQDRKLVAGARVRVFRCDYGRDRSCQLVGQSRAGEDGQFLIPGVSVDVRAAQSDGAGRLMIAATAKGHASALQMITPAATGDELKLELATDPGTLSGKVTDKQGRPLKGVSVFAPCCGTECIPGFVSAVTDEQGRYAIADLKHGNLRTRRRSTHERGPRLYVRLVTST